MHRGEVIGMAAEGKGGVEFQGEITARRIFAMIRQKRLNANTLHVIVEEAESGLIKSDTDFERRIRDEIAPASM